MVQRYIKKTPVVEAVRWTGYNFDEIQDFVDRLLAKLATGLGGQAIDGQLAHHHGGRAFPHQVIKNPAYRYRFCLVDHQ